jgi:outer membrane protein
MKKLLAVFTILFLLASCSQVKIAHVDVEEILKEYKGSKKAEEEMKAQSDKMANELDQLALPFQQKFQEYQQNSNSMSDSSRKEKELELRQEQQVIQQRQQIAQQQIQAEGQKKIEKINEEIESFLSDYAKTNGFTYILGTSSQTKSVLYGEESLNITDVIIEGLNESYNSGNENNTNDVLKDQPVN